MWWIVTKRIRLGSDSWGQAPRQKRRDRKKRINREECAYLAGK
jgi:hypothetical protein